MVQVERHICIVICAQQPKTTPRKGEKGEINEKQSDVDAVRPL